MKTSRYFFLLSIALIALVSSCQNKDIYTASVNIAEEGWKYNQPLKFDFEIKDTSQILDMVLNVTHQDKYPWQNLYVYLNTTLPSGIVDTQQLSIELADPTGKWYGQQHGERITAPILLQESVRFKDLGKYTLTVIQDMRINPVVGITEMELSLVKSETSKKKK